MAEVKNALITAWSLERCHPNRRQPGIRDIEKVAAGPVTFGLEAPKEIGVHVLATPLIPWDNAGMDPARRRSINEALVRLADGDRSSLTVLMDELWPVLLAFSGRLIGERADAEDVAQETLIKVAARIADYDRQRDGLTWVYAIAAYEIRTWRRKRYRRRELSNSENVEGLIAPTPSTEDTYIEGQLRQALADALGTLSESDRQALGIAEHTPYSRETSDAAIRKRRQRAVTKLRSLWSHLYG